MMRRSREKARERLRPLAIAYVESAGGVRPELHGRDAMIFAELLDEISLEAAKPAEPELPPAPPAAQAEPEAPPEQSPEEEVAAQREADELEVRASVLAKRELALARLHEALAEREREFEERAREVKETERRLARTAAELHERAALLDKRDAALAARERALAPPPNPEAPAENQPGMWDLEALERLVAERGDQHPERVEEWRYYLLYLRGHAAADGRLPASFDWLIAEVFAELLEPAAGAS